MLLLPVNGCVYNGVDGIFHNPTNHPTNMIILSIYLIRWTNLYNLFPHKSSRRVFITIQKKLSWESIVKR